MSVPDHVRSELRLRLWALADRVAWMSLSATDKARQYEDWTRQSEIGGVLSRFIDPGKVRVYLKDSLLKGYTHARLGSQKLPLRVSGIQEDAIVLKTYKKPHGCRLQNGKLVCWGRAEDWKLILMALHERSFLENGAEPFAAVLMSADGRFREVDTRRMVDSAARRLGIERLVWLDE